MMVCLQYGETSVNYELRIISGARRGRKVRIAHDPGVRPMIDRVRAALFSILGNAVPERVFYDVFAGSGAVGMEALSRGASGAVFVEKEAAAVAVLLKHLKEFRVAERATVLQADAYRWADKGAVPDEAVNMFLGPPYGDFDRHAAALERLVTTLREKLAPESVLIVQSEKELPAGLLGDAAAWDLRRYGRTQLAIWVKPSAAALPAAEVQNLA
jgi:16S rRNA (guanine966-N2)-methyltransferase